MRFLSHLVGASRPPVVASAHWRHESGNVLIELALIMPVFALLLLGAAEFAKLTYYSIQVANGARAGVQYGAQNHAAAADEPGMVSAASNDAAQLASGSDVTNIVGAATTVCECSNGTAITCDNAATMCVSPAEIIPLVQFTFSADVSPYIQAPGLPKTYALQSRAVMRVLQ